MLAALKKENEKTYCILAGIPLTLYKIKKHSFPNSKELAEPSSRVTI